MIISDTTASGNKSFINKMCGMERKFDMKDRINSNFEFGSINIRKPKYGYISEQFSYAEKLKKLPLDASFSEFRTLRHKLACLSLTRPEILATANILSKVRNVLFESEQRTHLNRTAHKNPINKQRGLKYHEMDKALLQLIALKDASFADNQDLSLELENFIEITDSSGFANVLSFSTYKSKRVVQYVLWAETYTFADCFDFAFSLQYELKWLFNNTIPIAMLTDSGRLFDGIVRSTPTSEKD